MLILLRRERERAVARHYYHRLLGPGWVVVLVLVPVLAGGLVLLEFDTPVVADLDLRGLWLLLGVVAALWVVPLLVELRGEKSRLISCKNAFLLVLFLQFSVWPAWILIADLHQVETIPITFASARSRQSMWATAWVILGTTCFYLGYYLAEPRYLGRGPTRITLQRWIAVDRTGFRVGLVGFVLLGVVGFAGVLSNLGGLGGIVQNIDLFRTTQLQGSGPLYLGMSGFFIAFLAAYCRWLLPGNGSKALWVILLIATIIVGLAGVYRHMAVEATAAWLFLYCRVRRRSPLNLRILLAIVGFLVLNFLYVSFRQYRGDWTALARQSGTLTNAVFRGWVARFHGTESLVRIVDKTEDIGYSGGKVFFSNLFIFWVPRRIWPEKPAPFGALVNVTFFPEIFSDTSQGGAAIPTLIGSLYWIAGPVGVAAGMILMGILLAYADFLVGFVRTFSALGTASQLFIFSVFANEALDLHLARLIVGLVLWWVMILISERRGSSFGLGVRFGGQSRSSMLKDTG